MKVTDLIVEELAATQNMVGMYLGDLSDADLLVRPVPAANHIAWQLGHLISSEIQLVRSQLPNAAYPELPAGFAEQHSNDTARQEPPKGFGTKQDYLDLFKRVREATIAAAAKLSDSDLDRATTGNMADFAPKLASFFLLVANHTLMHAGQFTTTRRKVGKPVLF